MRDGYEMKRRGDEKERGTHSSDAVSQSDGRGQCLGYWKLPKLVTVTRGSQVPLFRHDRSCRPRRSFASAHVHSRLSLAGTIPATPLGRHWSPLIFTSAIERVTSILSLTPSATVTGPPAAGVDSEL
jgi:hypothetical protein